MIGFMMVAIIFVVLGLTCLIVGASEDDPSYFMAGFILILLALLCGAIACSMDVPTCQMIEANTEIVAGETVLVTTYQCIDDGGEMYKNVEIEKLEELE